MVHSRRSTPAKKVEDDNAAAGEEASASNGVAPSVPRRRTGSTTTTKTTMDSPTSSVASSPDGNKDGPSRDGDYEAFRREKNKQAAREFRDRQKKTMIDLNNRVRLLEKEKSALSARLARRETEVQLYEQQISDYRDLLLLYSAKYGTEGIVISPQVKPADPLSCQNHRHQEEPSVLQPQQLAPFEICV